ncbi:50S ribosomal protein L35 [Nocardia sp. CDC159]|uniref:Large ribosomal subunit protein bL35 n=1 Tax=Nocardia pulmonis TaxID=2951408 RepID=A0A9X2EHM2_9NOCA|nr:MULTISPECIES: 50S ribosomal protein L35 [Nocardia]MCM6778833.1 50S ribosomal protein L35 [Nocardia pulmonis]MCM6791722.1 50S ribosomal protein L35 [Nocardia sp. CDC159]
MPKMKSHSGSRKRFKVTGTGKLMREQTGRRHLMEHKSNRVTRRLEGKEVVAKADVRRVKKLLGI